MINCIDVIITFIECFICYKTLEAFFENNCNKKKYYILKYLHLLLMTVLITIVNNISVYFVMILPFLVVILMSIGFYIINNEVHFLKVFTVVNLYYLLILTLDLFMLFLLGIILKKPHIGNIIGTGGGHYERIVFIVTMKMILIIVYFLLLRNIHNIKIYFEEYHRELFVISIILYVSVVCYQKIAFMKIEDNILGNWISFLITLILISVILGLRSKYQGLLMRENSMKLENQLLQKNFSNLDESILEISKKVHNTNAILTIIQQYLEDYKVEEAIEYIKKQRNELTYSKLKIWTENKLINYILNDKISQAQSRGIIVEEDIALSNINIRDEDLYIIIENIMDNAIEACNRIEKGEKWIHIWIGTINNMLIIKTANSSDNETISIKNGKLITSKENKYIHGLGLKIVREKVEFYNGHMDFDILPNEFRMNIGLFF